MSRSTQTVGDTVPQTEAPSFDLPYRGRELPKPQDVEDPLTVNMDAVDGTEHYEKTSSGMCYAKVSKYRHSHRYSSYFKFHADPTPQNRPPRS